MSSPAMDEEWSRPEFGLWNYSVTALVCVLSTAIGLYHAFSHRKQSSAAEFLMASRSMGVLPVTLSVLATYFSAISLLGIPAEMYTYGCQQWIFLLAYLLVIPITIYFYLPVFYQARVTSAYEYLELRFNSTIRKIASAIYIIQTVLMMVVVMYAPALALSQVTGLNIWGSVTVIGTICILYTTLGGMRAVLWTDAFQILIMLVSVGAVVIKGTVDIGGVAEVWRRGNIGNRVELFNFDTDPTIRTTFWSASVGGVFTWLCYYGVSQSLVQRYLTTKNEKIAQRALWWNIIGLIGMSSLYYFAGLLIYSYYWKCDPLKRGTITARDQLFPLYVMDILGNWPGLPGLFVAGVFSAALSTMSSGLNGLAATTLEDFIRPMVYKLSEKRATLLTKTIPFAYGALSFALVALADQMGNLVQTTLSISGMVGGPLLGVFSLGMFVPWANSVGAGIGFGAGLAVSGWLGIGAQLSGFRTPMLPVSTVECPASFLNGSEPIGSTMSTNATALAPTSQDVFPLYQISFMWYSTISCITVLLVGSFVSIIRGKLSSEEPPMIKDELISPPIRHLIAYFVSKTGSRIQEQTLEPKKSENEALLLQVISAEQKTKAPET